MSPLAPLERLKVADPETHVWVKGRLALLPAPPSQTWLVLLTDETIWGLSLETGLGRAVADGLLRLMNAPLDAKAHSFVQLVHQAADTGATLAHILATHLVPVLLAGDRMRDVFLKTLAIMRGKGTYTLNAPLDLLTELLTAGDHPAAEAYLDLLAMVFRQPMTYNQSVRLVHLIPKAIHAFPVRRRTAQLAQLTKVAQADLHLVDAFIDGMQKGLELLPPENLELFVNQALIQYGPNPKSALNFLSLASASGQEACIALQVAAPLSYVQSRLNRYLSARLGRSLAVRPLSDLGSDHLAPHLMVCSDSRLIYLVDEIDHFDSQPDNISLYRVLARLEAGFFESGTFGFDLERAADLYPAVDLWIKAHPVLANSSPACEAQRFFSTFGLPLLADDLFAVFEQARVVLWMKTHYPGLIRQTLPVLENETRRIIAAGHWDHPLAPWYLRLVLSQSPTSPCASQVRTALDDAAGALGRSMDGHSPVETSALMTCLAFDALVRCLGQASGTYAPLAFPFGHRPQWQLVTIAQAGQAAAAADLKLRLAEKGLMVYQTDLQNRLADQQGRLSAEDIQTLVLAKGGPGPHSGASIDWSGVDLEALMKTAGIDPPPEQASSGPAFYYPEWDTQLQDYLKEHVRVQQTAVAIHPNGTFYHQTLTRRRGLIAHMRRAFELLKPEALAILRQWPEGDDFDYRALLDFAVDRRAGRIPSDRLYIKRLKQERDVAVLLLVDVSRSTANSTADGQATVLEVAKEALVLFCQALQVVGDTYAIAGFSGTGRHSVDYFPIKDFSEPLTQAVRQRISALTPQRSTRMGAAIRHATAQMAKVAAKVRLMIVVSDGFPNDFGYKAEYAIADTRMAVQEARACGCHLKAITVNIGSAPGLDDLYGRFHHHVISDVRELPGKLLRFYGTLTKHY